MAESKTEYAFLIVALLVLIVWVYNIGAEKFVSPEARKMYDAARQTFSANGTYTDFKRSAPEADAVIHSDLRAAWTQRKLTPEYVQRVM